MGLAEISFPHTWYTIAATKPTEEDDGTPWFLITSMNREDEQDYSLYLSIGTGYYNGGEDVIDAINRRISKSLIAGWGKKLYYPILRYNQINKKCEFEMMKNQTIIFSNALKTMLGLGDSQTTRNSKKDHDEWMGENVCDVSGDIHSLYVYCDILEHVAVGDSRAPLLRVVEAKGLNGEIVNRCYDQPRYMPIQKKNFDSLEIDLRNDLGEKISFESGKLVVTLHFRKAQEQYFL